MNSIIMQERSKLKGPLFRTLFSCGIKGPFIILFWERISTAHIMNEMN